MNSKCVFYESFALPYTGIATNDSVQLCLQKIEDVIAGITDSGVGTVTSVAALTLGTSGTDLSSSVANPTSSPVITLNVPTASALNRGALSAADWSIFNGKGDMLLASVQTSTGKKTFQADGTSAGINVSSVAANPSTLVNGDVWYNSATNNYLGNSIFGPMAFVFSGSTGNVNNAVPFLTTGTTFPYLNQTSSFTYNLSTATLTVGATGKIVVNRIELDATATLAGINVGSHTADPSTLANADIWYDNVTNKFRARENGVSVNLIGGSGITVGTTTITSGTDTRIPFNDGGVYGEDSAFTWNKTNNALTINVGRIHSTGTQNMFSGQNAGNFTLTAINSVGFGFGALQNLSSGSGNTVFGSQAGSGITVGTGNTFVGIAAGNLATGSNNTCVGNSAGDNITSGSNNIIIGGVTIDAQSATASDQLSIQNTIFGSGNSATGTTASSGNLGFWATSWGTNAARVLAWANGTTPTTSPADSVQIYARDVAASSEWFVLSEGGFEVQIS